MSNTKVNYNYDIVKLFTIATVFWGVVGMLVGVIIAAQLAFPELNIGQLTFGRLRPIHTSAVIFAFGGNALFATSYFVVQRTCRTRLWGDGWSNFTFWGYQLFIVLAALGYVLGVTQSKEYAEPEWYADLWLTIVWVAYLIVFLMTLKNRKEPHKSYPVWGGVQSAMIQWWYGHNAVGFFLTAGFLGMVYYFIPKRANRPVYSYRLSIIHFWSLIFIYIWAGPHHLHYTALPDWAQTLGMTFSIMLWMPSWGGMINGMMTLSGAWEKLRDDPVLKFMIVSLAFYGMGTFEGPLMSIKEVNALSHYTDWTIGHVHSAALGWVGFITMGCIYYLVPVLWKKKELYSLRLVNIHLWVATTGIVLYITAMWVSGIMQGLMWRDYTELGFLKYSFVETVMAMHPYYIIRTLGGILYLAGMIMMVYNLIKTVKCDVDSGGKQNKLEAA